MSGKYLQDSLSSNCKSCCWIPVCLHLKQRFISGSLQALLFFISDARFKCWCLLLSDLLEASLRFVCWPNCYVWEFSDTKVCSIRNLVPCFDHLEFILKVFWGNAVCLLITLFGLFKSMLSLFEQSTLPWLYYWQETIRETGLILCQSLS